MTRRNIFSAAHYDLVSLPTAIPISQSKTQPTPGADNGASGVAVLVGTGAHASSKRATVCWFFFDEKINGKLPGWDWTLAPKPLSRR